MNKKLKYIIPILLVMFSVLAYAGSLTLTIPTSHEGPSSILTWGEPGTYAFKLDGLDPDEVTACVNKADCKWRLNLIVNGVEHWNGALLEVVGQLGTKNHVTTEVTDLGGGSAEVKFTAKPPSDDFAGDPFTTWTWHGIEYQTWLLTAVITKRFSVQKIGGSVSLAVIENMEKVNEFLTDMTEQEPDGVQHLNYLINDPDKGALTLTNTVYNYECTTYKDGWDTFKSGELTLAKESLEDVDALRETQAANYAGFTVQDAGDIQTKIKLAADRYKNAANMYIDDFNGCPCVEGCE